jgi:hypothetical protein
MIPYLKELVENRAPIIAQGDVKRINIFNGVFSKEVNQWVIDYIEAMLTWQPRFFDYPPDELLEAAKRFGNGCIYLKHYYNQLGYTDTWFSYMSRSLDGDEGCIQRELIPRRSSK